MARDQKQLIRLEQLVGLGLSERATNDRVKSRTLFGVHDKVRDQDLVIAGWIVVHFTRNQIALAPEMVGPRLVALTTR